MQVGWLVLCWLLPQVAIAVPSNEIDLDFSLPSYQSTASPVAARPIATKTMVASPISQDQPVTEFKPLFEGGSESLVARAIGSAEGTRTPTGQKTSAYYGHIDPGNGAWNLGSFSYQHGAQSPEEADQKQLARLEQQAQDLGLQASAKGLELTVEEKLNGLDLANQAPLAALAQDGGSYVDRLQQAHEMGLRGDQAILWARTYAYFDPKTQRWNAPGLGNTLEGITQDQQRRLQAVTKAIAVSHQVLEPPKTIVAPQAQPIKQELSPPPTEAIELDLQPTAPIVPESIPNQVTEAIIFRDLPDVSGY